jgi:alanine racemase
MQIQEPESSHYIEISKSALQNNVEYIRKNFVPSATKFSSVVKGNAYGHGIKPIVEIQQRVNDVDHFSVFTAYEALEVHKSLINNATIMIMGESPPDSLPWIINNNIEFFVYDATMLNQVIRVAREVGKKAKIHLEAETGMNRTGILLKDFKKCTNLIQDNAAHIEVIGLSTHFAGAESIANHVRVKKQLEKFDRFKKFAKDQALNIQTFHTACSAAAIRLPKSRMDMVRIGILQYGFWPNQETYILHYYKNKLTKNPLKRVLTWKSRIMSLKSVKHGEFIGYGTKYFADEDKKIAVIPTGYANGYARALSNQARVLVRGEYANITGNVNMNCVSVDVTNVPGVQIGDEVVLIGGQGEKEIKISSFSDFTSQIDYEVLARLPLDLPRRIVA